MFVFRRPEESAFSFRILFKISCFIISAPSTLTRAGKQLASGIDRFRHDEKRRFQETKTIIVNDFVSPSLSPPMQ
mgnify:FL=1